MNIAHEIPSVAEIKIGILFCCSYSFKVLLVLYTLGLAFNDMFIEPLNKGKSDLSPKHHSRLVVHGTRLILS